MKWHPRCPNYPITNHLVPPTVRQIDQPIDPLSPVKAVITRKKGIVITRVETKLHHYSRGQSHDKRKVYAASDSVYLSRQMYGTEYCVQVIVNVYQASQPQEKRQRLTDTRMSFGGRRTLITILSILEAHGSFFE